MIKYGLFSLDRYKLRRSEMSIVESEEDDISKFVETEVYDEEVLKYIKDEEGERVWVSEEGDEWVYDGEESGLYVKKIV